MKRTPMVTALLLSGLVLTFTACKKNGDQAPIEKQEDGSVKVENGRLAFKTNNDYYKYTETVKPETSAKAGFRSLHDALIASYKKKDSDPGLSSTLADLDKFGFPSGFLAALNEKGEVKIGDEIIWYHNGNKYWIPASEEANLETIKQRPEQIKKFYQYVTTTPKNENARFDLPNNGLDARHQHVFFPLSEIPPHNGMVGSERKYVHEIYGKYDPIGEENGIKIYRALVILRLKMEWRGCCDWNPNASEERAVSASVNGTIELPNMSRWSRYIQGPSFNVSDSRASTRENVDIPLVIAEVVGNVPPKWTGVINGTITSRFIGATDDSGLKSDSGVLWD
jgi:hypothetical protein